MEKMLNMKIKSGPIEIEVAGETETVKEQFDKAVMAVKEIHNMQIASGSEAADKLIGPLMSSMLEDLKK